MKINDGIIIFSFRVKKYRKCFLKMCGYPGKVNCNFAFRNIEIAVAFSMAGFISFKSK